MKPERLASTRLCRERRTRKVVQDTARLCKEREVHSYSRWKAASKCKQQLGRSLNANLPPEQRPYQIGFLAQKAQPGPAVGSKSQIG